MYPSCPVHSDSRLLPSRYVCMRMRRVYDVCIQAALCTQIQDCCRQGMFVCVCAVYMMYVGWYLHGILYVYMCMYMIYVDFFFQVYVCMCVCVCVCVVCQHVYYHVITRDLNVFEATYNRVTIKVRSIYRNVCVSVCTSIYIYIYMYIYKCIYICVYIYVYMT